VPCTEDTGERRAHCLDSGVIADCEEQLQSPVVDSYRIKSARVSQCNHTDDVCLAVWVIFNSTHHKRVPLRSSPCVPVGEH
jgi:hypothetical protein